MKRKKLCESCFGETKEKPCPFCGHEKSRNGGDMSVLPMGTKLDGRFIVGGVIGKGGFGITYSAYDIKNEKKVAVKEYFPGSAAGRTRNGKSVSAANTLSSAAYSEGMEKFYREAELVSRFNGNPNIVSVYDCFYENGTAYFVMEYLDGETLEEYINGHGVLSEAQGAYLADKLAMALIIVHSAGLLHRDISPDNIMICRDGKIKLIDFGAARQFTAGNAPKHTVIAKTGFTAAEQYSVKGNFGAWTDIYSAGAVLYYALTGKKPLTPYERMVYDGEFTETSENIKDARLREIVRKAAGISEPERYRSAEELRSALSELDIEEEPLLCENDEHTHINIPISETGTVKRHTAVWAVSAAAAAVLLGTAGFAVSEAGTHNVPAAALLDEAEAYSQTESETETASETEVTAAEAASEKAEDGTVKLLFDGGYQGNMIYNGNIPYELLESFGGDVAVKLEFDIDPDKPDYETTGLFAVDSDGRNMINYMSAYEANYVEKNGFVSLNGHTSWEFVITRAGIEALDGKDLGFETLESAVRSAELKSGTVKSKFIIEQKELPEFPREELTENGGKVYIFNIDEDENNGTGRLGRVIPREAFLDFDSAVKVTVEFEKTVGAEEYASITPINEGAPNNALGRNYVLLSETDEYGFPVAAEAEEETKDFWIQVYPKSGRFSFVIDKNHTDRISGGMNFGMNRVLIKNVRLESYEEGSI